MVGLSAAIIIVLGAVSIWLHHRKAEPAPKKTVEKVTTKKTVDRPRRIQSAKTPAPVVTNKPLTKEERRAKQLKQIRDKYGDNIPDNLKPVVYYLENPPQQIFEPAKSKGDIFKRQSEREIAALILTEPGTWFMRRPNFGDRFDSDFKASLNEKIEFSDSDTEEERALKEAVIETKNELLQRATSTEKPSDIMNAFAGSLYELGQYRRTLQDELGRLKRDSTISDADIESFVNAANKMLTDRGAQPIKMPKMILRHISLKRAAERAVATEKSVTEKGK